MPATVPRAPGARGGGPEAPATPPHVNRGIEGGGSIEGGGVEGGGSIEGGGAAVALDVGMRHQSPPEPG
jgi:hypothetical protein